MLTTLLVARYPARPCPVQAATPGRGAAVRRRIAGVSRQEG